MSLALDLAGAGACLDNGSGNECNLKDGRYHVSGTCQSGAAIAPTFAFERDLTTSQSCSGRYLNFLSDSFTIGVCQDEGYILLSDSDSPGGSALSMHTATGQSNLIGIVADGTNTLSRLQASLTLLLALVLLNSRV